MISKQTTYRLSDIVNVIGGGTPKRSVPDYWLGDIPWLSVGDFNTGNRWVDTAAERISEQGLRESSTKLLKAGQLIISARGTVGCLAQLTRAMAFNQSCYGLDGKKEYVINDYLYYLVKQKVDELIQKSHGAVFNTITISTFDQIEVAIPTVTEQKKIADILGDLDKRVELNSQINQTLEHIVQAIFKSWFVDFEPVKAKQHIRELGGNEVQTERAAQAVIAGAVSLETIITESDLSVIDQQLTLALSEKLAHQTEAQRQHLTITANHFPNHLLESELGPIPKGWEATFLSKIIRLVGGGTPKKSEPAYWGGNIPWFSVKDAPSDGQVYVLDTDQRITDLGLQKSSTKLLCEGATIISARGTVGKLALVGVPMAMNQSCYGVIGADGFPSIFNYFNLKRTVDVLKQNTHGAVFDTITTSTFETVDQVAPPSELACLFERAVEPLLAKVKSNTRQSQDLQDLRDSLLPKLLSGEIEVNLAA